jgi:hypothetical protein
MEGFVWLLVIVIGYVVVRALVTKAKASNEPPPRTLNDEDQSTQNVFWMVHSLNEDVQELVDSDTMMFTALSVATGLINRMTKDVSGFGFYIPKNFSSPYDMEFLEVLTSDGDAVLFSASRQIREGNSVYMHLDRDEEPPDWFFDWRIKENASGSWSSKLDEFHKYVNWLGELKSFLIENVEVLNDPEKDEQLLKFCSDSIESFRATGKWFEPDELLGRNSGN